MNIIEYRNIPSIASCPNAFLATGTRIDDAFNRKLLDKNQTGEWFTARDRVKNGDAIFLILPNKERTDGYPRELYAGVIKRIQYNASEENKTRALFSVNKFIKLNDIESNVRHFLNGSFPPTGSTLLSIWNDTHIFNKSPPKLSLLKSLLKAENSFENISSDEKEVVTKYRLNQGKLRKACLKLFGNQCCLSRVSIEELLICSHIKPWVASEADEKCDPENTLLLAATWDRLFDRGYISFSSKGKIVISELLSDEDLFELGIHNNLKIDEIYLTSGRKKYLAYHRKYCLRKL